jgi:hypothetical protein
MTKLIRIACAVATALTIGVGAHAQGTGNDRCVERINNDARKIVDARSTKSGALLVDFPAQLPGPGVVSAPGQLDLSQVLPLGLFSP